MELPQLHTPQASKTRHLSVVNPRLVGNVRPMRVRDCRLEGVALVVPAVNYWWPSVPPDVARRAYGRLPVQDRRTIWIAHHAPSLIYGWMTQKWFPTLSASQGSPDMLTEQDLEILQKVIAHRQSTGVSCFSKLSSILDVKKVQAIFTEGVRPHSSENRVEQGMRGMGMKIRRKLGY